MINNLLENDIENIVKNTKDIANYFKGKRVLITGGNGFLGKYIIKVFQDYNKFLEKPVEIIVYDVTIKKSKNLKSPNINFIKKDVSNKFTINKRYFNP